MTTNRRGYHENTRHLVFSIADTIKELVQTDHKEISPDKPSAPVILIDGPAGVGKSTFTSQLIQRLQEINVSTCFFEQDRFGLDRDKKNDNLINPCADLARDPETVTKLQEVMRGRPTLIPEYNRQIGKRIKDQVTLNPGDVVVYEGISCLSSVIYDNPNFKKAFRNAAPIKIFFTTDTDETLYNSRLKRDVEERGADPLEFKRQWDIFDRMNCLYTDRGKQNANFIVTRTATKDFIVSYVKPIIYSGIPLRTGYDHLLLAASEQIRYHDALIQKRNTKLMHHQKKWFHAHFIALSAVLACSNIDTKTRMTLHTDFYLSMISNFIPYQTTSSEKPLSIFSFDDELLTTTKRQSNPVRRVLEMKNDVTTSYDRFKDDSFFALHKKIGLFAEQALLHDKKFNNKAKISIENSLAAVTLDNYPEFSSIIATTSAILLRYVEPIMNRFMREITTPEEEAAMKFLIKPFLPDSKEMELGRMLTDHTKTSAEVAQWLIDTLKSQDKEAFFTHMRFHIRFMHLVTASASEKDVPPVPSSFMHASQVQSLKNVRKDFKPDFAFGDSKNTDRGRFVVEDKKTSSLRSQFGTYTTIEDILPPFRKLIGERSLPLHSAGVEYLKPITTTTHNIQAFEKDVPLVSSASGAMPFLLCVAHLAGLEGEDLKKYHLACLAHLIGGGHHSLSECMIISQYYPQLHFSNTQIQELIPPTLHNNRGFKELIELSNRAEFNELWIIKPAPRPENGPRT